MGDSWTVDRPGHGHCGGIHEVAAKPRVRQVIPRLITSDVARLEVNSQCLADTPVFQRHAVSVLDIHTVLSGLVPLVCDCGKNECGEGTNR